MRRMVLSLLAVNLAISSASAQTVPTYSKEIRPFLTRYCLECHNAKTLKGSLNLETYKTMMDGSDAGPVIKAGKPDESRLVLLCEGKDKPTMPPPKAKFQPTKEEIALLRAWVASGAKDDGASVKVLLPAIKPNADVLAPVSGLAYLPRHKELWIARPTTDGAQLGPGPGKPTSEVHVLPTPISAVGIFHLSEDIFLGLGSAGESGYAVRFDEKSKDHLITSAKHADLLLDMAISRDVNWLATAGYASKIYLQNGFRLMTEPPTVHELKEHSDAVYGLAFNPKSTLLASVSADRTMKVTNVESGKLLYTLGEANDWLYAVAWSPDGKYLVSGGVDKSIRVYEPTSTSAKLRQSVFAHQGAVLKLVFSGDSKTLYSVGEDRVVKAWDIEKMVERKVYDAQPDTVLCLALREDAQQIILGRYDGIVQLIDMKTGKVAHEFGAVKKAIKPRNERSDSRGSGLQANPRESSRGFISYIQEPIAVPAAGSSPATGQKITLPAKLAGAIDRAGAMHFFRLDAHKGQPLGVKLVTKELNSKLDPVLVVADLSGHILAESYDGHLGYTFPANGSYAIGVRDRDYRGGADFKYRLHLGDIPVVTALHPLGLQRGTENVIHVQGVFLDQQKVHIKVPADAAVGSSVAAPITSKHGEPLGRRQLIVGEFPDVFAGRLPVPATANGQIRNDGQKDTWTFAAKKGERLIVEVNARRIGSRLDSVIEILDAKDQPVPRVVLRSQAKTHVTFRDHDSAQPGIRIEAWSELATNDLLYVGNELMKIQSLPTHPDADCIFFSAEGKRLGYLDTTPIHHANNTPMYKVSLHPAGSVFPPNGYPVFTLYYRNDDGGAGYGRDSRIVFDPPAAGDYQVRITDARGMGGDNLGYRLTVRPPRERFTLKATPASPVVSRGGAIPITFTAERIDGFAGPITVRVKNLPAGLHLPPTTIEAGTYTTTAPLYAGADAQLPKKVAKLEFEGTANAAPAYRGAIDMPKLIEPGDIVTTTAATEVTIKPGQQAKLTVGIERRNGFTGRVPLDVKGLPHGVRVLDIGLNGILVNEKETQRTIVLYAEPWVQAADRPIVVLARREGKNTEHAAKAVLLQVK